MMIPTALYPITDYIEDLGILSPLDTPKKIAQKSRFFSKGSVSQYKGEGIEKFVNLTVKGLHLYHYDFGMVYPEKDCVYPIFFYQVIIAPQRILVLVHYAFEDPQKALGLAGIDEILQQEVEYEEMFIKEFTPQSFVAEEVIPSKFNGLIRTRDIDKAYKGIAQLLSQWHKGMLQQGKSSSKEEVNHYENWFRNFRSSFYHQDYGFHSTKRYLGEKWTKEVFENYIFNI